MVNAKEILSCESHNLYNTQGLLKGLNSIVVHGRRLVTSRVSWMYTTVTWQVLFNWAQKRPSTHHSYNWTFQKGKYVFVFRKALTTVMVKHQMEHLNQFTFSFCVTCTLQCSVECGTGTQFRTVFCAGEVGGMYQEFPDESCPRNSKPTTVQSCGNDSCAPQWFTTKWGKVHYKVKSRFFSSVYVCIGKAIWRIPSMPKRKDASSANTSR